MMKAPPGKKSSTGKHEQPEDRILKRRTIWVAEKGKDQMTDEEESSDTRDHRSQKTQKGRKYSKWIMIDDDAKVKAHYRIPSQG